MSDMSFKSKLRFASHVLGFQVKELANFLGVSSATIYGAQYEGGGNYSRLVDVLYDIANSRNRTREPAEHPADPIRVASKTEHKRSMRMPNDMRPPKTIRRLFKKGGETYVQLKYVTCFAGVSPWSILTKCFPGGVSNNRIRTITVDPKSIYGGTAILGKQICRLYNTKDLADFGQVMGGVPIRWSCLQLHDLDTGNITTEGVPVDDNYAAPTQKDAAYNKIMEEIGRLSSLANSLRSSE